MEFAFTEEQRMIRDTAEAFLAEVSTSEAVRQTMASSDHYCPDTWQRICSEMYWQAIHIPEEYGGMGLGYVEIASVLEHTGKRLLCSPLFATVCLASNALIIGGSEAQKTQYLAAIAEGSTTATFAYNGGSADWSATGIAAVAKVTEQGFSLSGDYHFVVDGCDADVLIVAAYIGGGDDKRLGMFVLPADADGISRSWTPTLDQTRAQATIQCDNVQLSAGDELCGGGSGESLFATVTSLAAIGLAAEQMGGCDQLLDLTVEYAKERHQFNRPIASFQAIKHKAADMMLANEVARSAVYYAACVADEALNAGPLADELHEAASIAQAYCSKAYFSSACEAMQIHGGVGFTWEYDVHLHFKRAKASELYLGDVDDHLNVIAAQLLDDGDQK